MFIIGHRGAKRVEPENTLRAIRTGMACADYVEVDVRLSRDGIPVIMHDPDLDRTTNGTGPVNDYTLEALKTFDAGKGEPIPTLAEVLRLVSGRCGLVVDIKEQGSETRVCQVIREYEPDDLFVVSFHPESVIAARTLIPSAQTGIIALKDSIDLPGTVKRLAADALFLKYSLLSDAIIRESHARDLLVVSWTLNSPDEFRTAIDRGIDGVATDDPCKARKNFPDLKKRSE